MSFAATFCPVPGCLTLGRGQQRKFYYPHRFILHCLQVHNKRVLVDACGNIVYMNGVPQFENESQVIIHEAQMTDDASNMIVDDTSNMIVPYGPFSSAAIAGGGSASSAAMDICSVTSIRKSERLQKKDVDAISSIGCSSFANMAISTDEEKYLKECLAALRKKKSAKKSANDV